MNRLTFKDINPFTNEEQYYPKSVQDKDDKKIIDFTMQSKCNNKLGQLEDIEEELEIDLITLYKVWISQKYIHLKYLHDSTKFDCVNYEEKYFMSGDKKFYFKDYCKTWTLTEEELESI